MWNSHPPAKAFEQRPIIPSSFGESTNCGRLANIKGLNLITVMLGMLCGQKTRIWHTATNQKCDWLIFGWRWGYGHSELFCCPSWHLIKVKSYLDRLGMHPWSLPTPEPKNQKFPKKTLDISQLLTGSLDKQPLRWDTKKPRWMLKKSHPASCNNFLKIYHEK